MHVAYIHQHFATRKASTGTRSFEMGTRLIERGHRVSMICGESDVTDMSGDGSTAVRELEIEGIQVKCIPERYENRMNFYQRVLAFGRFARRAAHVASGLDADLVFATSTPLTVGIPGMKASKRRGLPFVFEVRDLWPELPIAMGIVRNPLLKWYTRGLERKIYFAADKVIALAPGIRDGVCATGYPPDQVAMIPNGCDLELFQPCDEPLDDPRFGDADEFRLVFTGAHGQANGLDAVLDAALELKRRGVRGIRFVFIGRGGLKPGLVERSRREQLDDYVLFHDSVPKSDLAQILPRMDVGLMILRNLPSFYYGTSPNKFFDYIAGGLPVLNNYPGWLADMIRENECGVAIDPDNPRAFAEAVLDLYERRGELKAIGLRGRALAEREFAREQLADRFADTLEQVHAAHTRR